MTTRIKICGIVRPEDAAIAAELGADAIGIVFTPLSSRCVTIKQAQEIIAAIPMGVSVVGLFLDPKREDVLKVLQNIQLDWLQFHGRESPAFCRRFAVPYIKAIGAGRDAAGNIADLHALRDDYADAAALLYDGNIHGAAGGTGHRADWKKLPEGEGRTIVLAGGLTPENVAEAIGIVRPYAVDVSSGVEDSPGVKSRSKIEMFINEVRRADAAAI
ncbi:MAG: phosphoribosylanthranilate isomerase [Proteobacteria bacterium]|nr:phosphoribosylanthranilate isomerase [Pseudomonadota bacterium]